VKALKKIYLAGPDIFERHAFDVMSDQMHKRILGSYPTISTR